MKLEKIVVDDSTKMIHGDIGYDPKSKVVEVEDGEDDFGGALEVGGCCCSDGDEEGLMEVRVLVKRSEGK